MPLKPLDGLTRRKAKARTRIQKKSKTAGSAREVRLKNLEKARRVRKKNLRLKKKAAKK